MSVTKVSGGDEMKQAKTYTIVCESKVQAMILSEALAMILNNHKFGFQEKGRYIIIEME
jgi:hypothetical protein